MVSRHDQFADPLRVAKAAAERRRRRGIDYTLWTTPQRQVLQDERPVVVWRDGNQLGKSFWLAAEAIHTARGSHPYRRKHRPPCQVVVMGVSYEQMVPLMEKIWELVPKDEIDPRNGFDPGRGITGKPPRIVFVKGPGAGSVISFATYKQGARNLAGKTVVLIIMDEPPDQKTYGEVVPRVFRKGGIIRIGMTPTPDMPDTRWLQRKIEAEEIFEHNYGLTSANLWLEGAPGPFMTQEEVDRFEASILSMEREMRMGRSWDIVPQGRWLGLFDTTVNVLRMEAPIGARLGVGIDHGGKAGKQTAILLAHWDLGVINRRVLFLDETTGDHGRTTPRDDAEHILEMLDRNGFSYDDIDEWTGDRPLSQARHGSVKSNQILRAQFARILSRHVHQMTPIQQPVKYTGSERVGLRLLNGQFGEHGPDGLPMAIVHPRCTNFIKACTVYQGRKDDPVKDHLDGGRYAFERVARDFGTGKVLAY